MLLNSFISFIVKLTNDYGNIDTSVYIRSFLLYINKANEKKKIK